MWNSLKYSLEIELIYIMNSFIYSLRKLPIFRDLFTNDIYKNTISKKIIGFFGIVFWYLRNLFLKFLYFYIIYYVSIKAFQNTSKDTFIHIYFFLTIIGIYTHNYLINPNKKKYFSLILMNIDATSYLRANLIGNQIKILLENSILLFVFSYLLKVSYPITILLIIFSFFARLIGEAGLILFYKKYHYMWYSNSKYYVLIVGTCLLLTLLPTINIYLNHRILLIGTILSGILGTLSFLYLFQIKDYKMMMKEIFHMTNPMNTKNNNEYLKQAMIEVREKDKKIDSKKLQGKVGYDYLNTIFYERHKEILIRSAKRYSLILIGIYGLVIYFICNHLYIKTIKDVLNIHILYLPLLMYFINRGSIMTQAMFYNCDHALLRYNFYRESDALLGLFKKRLFMIIKVNLLPAIVIGIGNILVYYFMNRLDLIIINILLIFFLTIFFSVHYLVMYYLLQPYNKNMEMKSIPYLFVSFITYFISFIIPQTGLSFYPLTILVVLFTILYLIISLYLIHKLAPSTFKMH